ARSRCSPSRSLPTVGRRMDPSSFAPGATSRYKGCMSDVMLVLVGGGGLALTHRPKRNGLVAWKADGVTHVVTLLSERENARDIGDAATRAGLSWVWFRMPGAAIPDESATRALLPAIDQVVAIIQQGGRAVIHCSAGIHRTGMIGYAVLRRLGLSPDLARA